MDRLTKIAKDEPVQNQYVPHGVNDYKGREVGSRLKIDRVTVEWADDAAKWGFCVKVPGVYYRANIQATRNGMHFGAGFHDTYHDTFRQAEAHLAKSLKRSMARSRREYGEQE
jgi:hypothetical protein